MEQYMGQNPYPYGFICCRLFFPLEFYFLYLIELHFNPRMESSFEGVRLLYCQEPHQCDPVLCHQPLCPDHQRHSFNFVMSTIRYRETLDYFKELKITWNYYYFVPFTPCNMSEKTSYLSCSHPLPSLLTGTTSSLVHESCCWSGPEHP